MRFFVIIFATIVSVWFCHEVVAGRVVQDDRSLPVLGQADEERLSHLQSDEEADVFFTERLRNVLGLTQIVSETVTTRPSKARSVQPEALSPDLTDGTKLTAELAARQFAARLIHAADREDATAISTLLAHTPKQQHWLCAESLRPELCRAVKLATVLAAFRSLPGDRTLPESVDRYHVYLDRLFPDLVETDDSWLQLAEREGVQGIQQRLMKFWDDPSTGNQAQNEAEKQAWATSYFSSRLKPVLTAYTLASAIKARSRAEQRAESYWNGLKISQEQTREMKGLTRLCGTWQWTIHNHQHHLDQKVAMVFAHPAQESFAGPRPARTVVLGDVVYLRWEFPGGIQEDSLLFTGDGQRLEGSFLNSSGAWGSITGKRTAPCPRP